MSVEFISLLALVFLGSSILVTHVSDQALRFSEMERFNEAQVVAQKVSYTFDYVKAQGNASMNLSFDPEISDNYQINVSENFTTVYFDGKKVSVPSSYEGSVVSMSSSEEYKIGYNGGFEVE